MRNLGWFGALRANLEVLSKETGFDVYDVSIGSLKVRCYVDDRLPFCHLKKALFSVNSPEGESDFDLYCFGESYHNKLPAFPWTKGECLGRLEMENLPSDKHLIFDEDHQMVKVVDVSAGWGLLYAGNAIDFPSWEIYSPFREFLHFAAMQKKMLMVHAGSVAFNGQGVLLLGHGGAGKSTTVSQAVGQDFQSCGDDYVMVDTVGMTIHAVYRTFKLLPSTAFPVPETHIAQQSTIDERSGKTIYYFDRKDPHLVASCQLLGIHILERDDRYRSTALSGGPMLVKTMMSSVIQSPYDIAIYTRLFLSFAKRVPLYKTSLGTTQTALIASLQKILLPEEAICESS